MATKVTFSPLTWVNKVTKRSAANYNRMETGIKDCATATNALIDELATVNNNLTTTNDNLMNVSNSFNALSKASSFILSVKSGSPATFTIPTNKVSKITAVCFVSIANWSEYISLTSAFITKTTGTDNNYTPIITMSGATYTVSIADSTSRNVFIRVDYFSTTTT